MAFSDILVTGGMLQDLFGVPSTSIFNYDYILTCNDLYNYQGDWDIDLIESGGNKLVELGDIESRILDYGDNWIGSSGSYNEITFSIGVDECTCDNISQNRLNSPVDFFNNLNVTIDYIMGGGTCYQFSISGADCVPGKTLNGEKQSDQDSSNKVEITISGTYASDYLKYQCSLISFWFSEQHFEITTPFGRFYFYIENITSDTKISEASIAIIV